jgi:hypothetical protein
VELFLLMAARRRPDRAGGGLGGACRLDRRAGPTGGEPEAPPEAPPPAPSSLPVSSPSPWGRRLENARVIRSTRLTRLGGRVVPGPEGPWCTRAAATWGSSDPRARRWWWGPWG